MFSMTHSACVIVGGFSVIMVGLFPLYCKYSERSLLMGLLLASSLSNSRLVSSLENISSSSLESVLAIENLYRIS